MYLRLAPYVPVPAGAARPRGRWTGCGRRATRSRRWSSTGRAIAKTFWGKSWCRNLERYSDYSNRLPRGRTYVRNGSVVDLQIAPGEVTARVAGSSLYTVRVEVAPVPKARWARSVQGLRGRHRLPGRAAAGAALEGRHGAHLRGEDGPVPLARGDRSSTAAVPTGPRCASTSRPCSTASAPGSTRSPSCSSRCAGSTRRT